MQPTKFIRIISLSLTSFLVSTAWGQLPATQEITNFGQFIVPGLSAGPGSGSNNPIPSNIRLFTNAFGDLKKLDPDIYKHVAMQSASPTILSGTGTVTYHPATDPSIRVYYHTGAMPTVTTLHDPTAANRIDNGPATVTFTPTELIYLYYEIAPGIHATGGDLFGTDALGSPAIITLRLLPTGPPPPPPDPSDAILYSTLTTGIAIPNAAQSILSSAPQTALNTVNNRLFHARSQVGNPRGNGGGIVSSGRSNSTFFNFGQRNGLNLAQALGFEDIPVAAEVTDSEASFIIKGLTIETQLAATVAPEAKLWEIYTSGDYHAFDQDAIGAIQAGFDSDTFTGTVGAEYHVNEKLNIGLAYSYLDNRTKLSGNFGRVDVEGHLATAYATYFRDDNYVDVLYSRAYFDNSLMRNVPGGTALGTPDSMADIVNVNFGKNIDLGNGLVTGPIAGLDYTHGTIDAYAETGPAPAILAYGSRSYESLITRLGWQASKTEEVACGRLTVQGSLAWEKEHKPEFDTVNSSLVAFPNFTLPPGTAGAHPGTDWLGLRLGASLQTRSGVELGLNYQSQLFREDVTSHYVGAKVSVKF